jgi:hypothetical protein
MLVLVSVVHALVLHTLCSICWCAYTRWYYAVGVNSAPFAGFSCKRCDDSVIQYTALLTPLSTLPAPTATTAVAVAQDIDALVAQTAGHEGTMDPEVCTPNGCTTVKTVFFQH